MRVQHGLSYATTANITGGSQVAYMVGSLFAGVIGPKLGAGRLTLASVGLAAVCLLGTAIAESAWAIGCLVAAMSASAAVNWAAISALAGVYVPARRRGQALTVAATGSAWGVCANGVIVARALPDLGTSGAWVLTGVTTLIIAVITGVALFRCGALGDSTQSMRAAEPEAGDDNPIGLRHPAMLYACLFSILAGFAAVPFLTYLGAYLETEVGHPATLVGSVWAVLGITGAATGFVVGGVADRFGLPLALRGLFAVFVVSALIMVFLPTPPMVYGAGIGFGLMYFTLWGLISTYVNQFLAPGPAMRVIGITLVCVGIAAAIGNWAAGQWVSRGHSFADVYLIIAGIGCALIVLTTTMPVKNRRNRSL